MGRCQGRLHRRNATSYYPKRYLEGAQEGFAMCADEQEENGYVVQAVMALPSGCQHVVLEGDALGRG